MRQGDPPKSPDGSRQSPENGAREGNGVPSAGGAERRGLEPSGAEPTGLRDIPWVRGDGPCCDVVLSSRVRLARNLAGFPFAHRATDIDRVQILDLVKARLQDPALTDMLNRAALTVGGDPAGSPGPAEGARRGGGPGDKAPESPGLGSAGLGSAGPGMSGSGGRLGNRVPAVGLHWIDLHALTELERTLLVERLLVSKQHSQGKPSGPNTVADAAMPRGVAISEPDERVSVMVGEEDHLRIQAIGSGLSLDAMLALADTVDDGLEAGLEYAYSSRFGYLTACPTNVGTGIRLSVMLHLPGLQLTGEIDKARRSAEDMGLAVRGFFGEGSDATGNFYQISNQQTLGQSESMLLSTLNTRVLPQLIEYERRARRILATRRLVTTQDAVHRALGTLCHARLLSVAEAMKLLSMVRLGVAMDLIDGITLGDVHELILLVQRAHLQELVGRELDQQERRVERANACRLRLGGR